MENARPSFTALDAILVALLAGGLAVAALRSETFVPEPAPEDVELPEPAIQFRDQIYGIASPAPGVLWIAGNHGKILRSDDAGASWQVQPTPTIANLQDLAAWSPERAAAVGNDGIVLVTADGGATWTEIEAPRSQIVNKLFRLQTLPEGVAWAVGAGGMILSSRDWGATWERRSDQEDVAWNGLSFLDTSRGWVVGEFGRILRTSDAGATWEALESPVERSLMSVEFRNEREGIAVGLDGLILRSEDGGDSWTVLSSGTTVHLFHVLWDGQEWVAAGDGGILVAGDPLGRVWEARPLGDHELGWHTEALRAGDRLLLVGASQGFWRGGEWNRFTG